MATYARAHKRTSVPGFVAAIANHAHNLGHGALPRFEQYRRLIAGIQNYHADQLRQPKHAITLADLRAIRAHTDVATFDGARNWCACLLAFFGLLRINEYANGGLRHGDVRLSATGVTLTVPFSKTSLQPTDVELAARADDLCPARALAAYLVFFDRYPALSRAPSAALFVTRRADAGIHNTTDSEFIAIVRALLQRADPLRDTSRYAGHSFRRGGTTALKQWGVSDADIQRHGRWRSDAYRQYIDGDHNLAVRLHATQAIPAFAP